MKRVRCLCLLVVLPAISGAIRPQPHSLEEVLDAMASHGGSIQSMKASIEQQKWTEILEEFDSGEKGKFLFLKRNNEIFLRKDMLQPQPNHLLIASGQVIFYQPRIKQAQQYNLGGNRDKAEFLLLGFGTSRKALEQAYRMRLLGTEEIGKRTTYMLELEPRSNQVSAFFSRIILWIDPQLWIPVRQKLVEPTEDYLLVDFRDIELNPKLSRSDFEIKLPRDVKVVGR